MKILPVIVIYKISLTETECFRTFLSKIDVDKYVVYDNSPSDYIQLMDEISTQAIYVRDTSNGGVSAAYNTAAKYATDLGYARILLLDQDTVFPLAMYDMMLHTEQEICAPKIVLRNGMPFSPTEWKLGRLRGVSLAAGEYPLDKYLLVNSGLCISTHLFNKAGGYNDKVKLDFADFQFMYRLQKVSKTFLLLDVTAEQDFSNDKSSVDELLSRFNKYLDGARNFQSESVGQKVMILWLVLLHTIALTMRTKSMLFLKKLLQNK